MNSDVTSSTSNLCFIMNQNDMDKILCLNPNWLLITQIRLNCDDIQPSEIKLNGTEVQYWYIYQSIWEHLCTYSI